MKKKPSSSPKKRKAGGKKGKKKYKVRNWREYNQALVDRGSIFFWIEQSAQEQWNNSPKTGNRGKPELYSNTAIETCLTLQQVFHLTLRGTEGFVNSLFRLMNVLLASPDYSTLSLRASTVPVCIHTKKDSSVNESLHIVVDSSGAKVYGEGEWKVRMHGWSKRRTWRKFHLGIDELTGTIKAAEITGNDVADCEMFQPLLEQIPNQIDQVSADGAYDKRICYAALKERQVSHIAIPPRHNARIWSHGNALGMRHARDENLRRIRKIGRKQWKVEVNYHRRSLVETTMSRIKTIFDDRVSARTFENQRTQLLIRCRALNLMTTLGMPDSYAENPVRVVG